MTKDDIARLLDFMGVQVRQNHIDAFLRRCDRDADFKLDLDEWLMTIGSSFSIIEAEIKRIEDARIAEQKRIEDEAKAKTQRLKDEYEAEVKRIEDERKAEEEKRE